MKSAHQHNQALRRRNSGAHATARWRQMALTDPLHGAIHVPPQTTHTYIHAFKDNAGYPRSRPKTHTCFACISPLASAVCTSRLRILLYTARCLHLTQRKKPLLNFQNPVHTLEQLSGYVRVNISCSEKPLNYLFDTPFNVLNKRNTSVVLTVSSLAHNTDPLPECYY